MTRRPASAIVAFAALGALLLTACGDGGTILNAGNDQPDATVNTAPNGTTTTTEPATTTSVALAELPPCNTDALAGASGPVEIEFWHGMNGLNNDTLTAFAGEYNASQSKVHVTVQAQGGYEQNITKYLQSSDDGRPDLVQFPEYAFQLMVDNGKMIPAQACVEAAGDDLSTFLPKAISAYSTEGVQWAMPFNISDPILYFNRKIVATAGLDPDAPPQNLAELRSACEQIVSSGAATTCIALDSGTDSGGGWFLEQWLANAGLPYANNDNGRSAPATAVAFNTPQAVELLTFVQDLVKDGLAVDVGGNPSGQDNFFRMAAAEPAAMTIGTSSALGQVIQVLGGGLVPGLTPADIGIGPLPGPAAAPSAVVGGAALWVVGGRDDATTAAVWDFVRFLTSAEIQSRWATATGYVPVRSDALELEPLRSTYANDPRFRVPFDQLVGAAEAVGVGPVLGPLLEVRVTVARMVAEVLGGADVVTSLAAAESQSNALISDYAQRSG